MFLITFFTGGSFVTVLLILIKRIWDDKKTKRSVSNELEGFPTPSPPRPVCSYVPEKNEYAEII